jgi:uncharacterized membrane protein YeaQ/YmgE (transglycosylase-associated protein family)
MINIIVWIIAGALIGWVPSIIMKTNNRQGLIADIIVGIVGAFLGGYFLSPLSTSAGSTRATLASLPYWCRWEVPSSCWRSPSCSAR